MSAKFTELHRKEVVCICDGRRLGFISDACRDAGQQALASRAELAGRCAVFIVSLPLLEQILGTAAELIK